jgi:hypothetical protein
MNKDLSLDQYTAGRQQMRFQAETTGTYSSLPLSRGGTVSFGGEYGLVIDSGDDKLVPDT